MGFFARLFAARGRRARRPEPAATRLAARGKRTAKPTLFKKAGRIRRPARNAVYSIERSITTSRRGKKKRKTTTEWRHGKCAIKHRTEEAAARCRNP